MMNDIIWEFRAQPGRESEFEAAYGAKGVWSHLFMKSPDYLGTTLLKDRQDAGRYLTVDRWKEAGAFARFKLEHLESYEKIDKKCEGLAVSEVLVGTFDVVESS
jgi:heme-degrading monooxygenase HmoA